MKPLLHNDCCFFFFLTSSLTSLDEERRRGACADRDVWVGAEEFIQLESDSLRNLEVD